MVYFLLSHVLTDSQLKIMAEGLPKQKFLKKLSLNFEL